MKNIYELLKMIGIEIPEDKKTEFDKNLVANYKTIVEHDKLKAQLDEANKQLVTAKDALKGFEGKDFDGIQKQLADAKKQLEDQEADFNKKVSEMEFDNALSDLIRASGTIDPTSVKAHLNIEDLKKSNNRTEDINKAIADVKNNSPHLFEQKQEPIKTAVQSGGAKNQNNNKKGLTKADIMAVKDSSERQKLISENPSLFGFGEN